MDRYALMKRFQHNPKIQFYMYDFMYADTEKIPEEHLFSATIFL